MRFQTRGSPLKIDFLPSNLHVRPLELKDRMAKEFEDSKAKGERIICLYGNCFTEIDDLCAQYGARRPSGFYCYEMFLGSALFRKILDETAGTFFVERDLLDHFDEYCTEPLELHDEEMRLSYFRHYRKILYIRQPADPDLRKKLDELSEFLELSLEIQDADYRHLERKLCDLIRAIDTRNEQSDEKAEE